MGSYNYKYARDQIPPFIIKEIKNYDGDPGYDGDQWIAASDYMYALEIELSKQYAQTKIMHDEKLLEWLKTRPETRYTSGPVIMVWMNQRKRHETYNRDPRGRTTQF